VGKKMMKRLKIGLNFFFDYKSWAGGVIYILNIIHSLNLLDDESKPELYIYYAGFSPIEDIEKINYPFINYSKFENYPPSLLKRHLSFLCIRIFGRSYFFKDKPDLIYPYIKFLSYGKRNFFWIPDFQEYYLPEFFTASNIKNRKDHHKFISEDKNGIVVFSSNDAMNDFKKFYPRYVCQVALVRFACILPEFKHLSITNLRNKFNISENYFMVTNQFWAHKNHKIILEAITLLKSKDLDFKVVFTGSTHDKRNPVFFKSISDYIESNDISKFLIFLGFIDRDEQLKLMDESLAIIQPSLFEGWSTVVEDAKALSQHIILSSINVHKEQISENCTFFNPKDATELALIIENILTSKPTRIATDYQANIIRFGKEFLDVVKTSS
jgi:glycosyltransferase involved in cell wall biosynthesis